MTASIQQLDDTEIKEAIEDFDSSGGCIQFELFRIEGTTDEYDCHHKTALHTLKTMNNGSGLFRVTIDETKLRDSGHRIEIEEFFGPLFDIDTRRVIVKGRTTNHLNDYFFHDGKEHPSEIVDVKTRPYYQDYTSEFVTLGFTGAFLDPPHYLETGQTIFHHGDYFLRFCDKVFGNVDNLVVYKWSTDSSNIFDAGKEWWGSFFWTVYNQTKDFYIGIVASTTD
jgi:hypothetical protein